MVSRANTFLYVAGPGTIFAYTIATDGSLTAPTTGATVAIVNAVSLDVSPDGNWLMALEGVAQTVECLQDQHNDGRADIMTTSDAVLGDWGDVVPTQLRVAPNGNYVFAALGTGGDVVFTFNTSRVRCRAARAFRWERGEDERQCAGDRQHDFSCTSREVG